MLHGPLGEGPVAGEPGRHPPNLAPGAVTNTGVVPSVQTLIRNARLVPVAGVPAPTDEPLDLRVVDGIVTDVAERLAPELDDEVFDAAGRWAAPGLWDHHVHMSQWADVASRLDMSGTHAPEEVVARVARHIDTLDPRDESVVSGYGHRTGTWTRLPTVAELDAVSGQHPVVLISGDAHHGWLNSAALSLLGVPPRQTTLDENDWFPVFGRLGDLPGAGLAHKLALREVVRDAAARGVVGVTDLEFGGAYLDWPERFAQGVDSLRVRAATYAEGLADVVAAGLRSGDDLADSDGLLEMGPLKIISDGSLNTRTAYCCTQYPDGHLLEYPQGRLNNSPEELVELFTTAHRNGLRVALHAIGDAALSLGLDAFSATGARGGIEHAQLVDLADLPRMAELGVRASVQPAHLLDDRDVTERCWPERTHRCFAFRSMLDRRRRAGARLRRPGRGARPVAGDVRGRAPHRGRARARGTPSRRSPPPRHWPPAPTDSPRSGAVPAATWCCSTTTRWRRTTTPARSARTCGRSRWRRRSWPADPPTWRSERAPTAGLPGERTDSVPHRRHGRMPTTGGEYSFAVVSSSRPI